MGNYIIDQEAFVAYLKEEIKARETAEVTFCHSGNYDSASKAVSQKYALGDILLKIEGSEYTPPFVKDEKHPDGFMVCTEDAPCLENSCRHNEIWGFNRVCPHCKEEFLTDATVNFCPVCGKPVKDPLKED